MSNETLGRVTLRNVRLSYLQQLWVPKAFVDASGSSGTPEFQATGIMPAGHPGIALMQAAIRDVARATFGQQWEAALAQLELQDRVALHSNRTRSTVGYEDKDGWWVKAGNKVRVPVMDADGVTPLGQSDGRPYAGCYGTLHLQVWGQRGWGKRINCGLRGVQFVAHGEAFGGGTAPASLDDFERVEGSESPDFV